MLHKAKDLRGDALHAHDGRVGSVDDLYFDEQYWDVRYLLVNGPEERCLVSPIAIDREHTVDGDIRVDLTREQISRCPKGAVDDNLHPSSEVIGYHIEAIDGVVGNVADLVIDDETWEITDLLVDSRDWLPGRLLLISPQVVERVDWPHRKLHLRLARQDILQAPQVQL